MSELIVSITGASGAVYGLSLLRALVSLGRRTHVIVSEGGARVLQHECGLSVNPKQPDARLLAPERPELVTGHSCANYGASIASGSCPVAGMAVVPCSMGTLARIASGMADNLVGRAADVCLKERRRLVLVPRDTPLSAIHLENMLRVTNAGGVILPASPGFYAGARTVDDLVRFVVARILDHLSVEHDLGRPWQG